MTVNTSTSEKRPPEAFPIGRKTRERAWMGAMAALNRAAHDIKAASQAEMPHDTGAMRNSARVEPNDVELLRNVPPGRTAWVQVIVGGEDVGVPYAAAQHEGEMFYRHHLSGKIVHWVVRNHPRGGKT